MDARIEEDLRDAWLHAQGLRSDTEIHTEDEMYLLVRGFTLEQGLRQAMVEALDALLPGKAVVVANASSISTPNSENTMLASRRKVGSTIESMCSSSCCSEKPVRLGSWAPSWSGVSVLNQPAAVSRMSAVFGFML